MTYLQCSRRDLERANHHHNLLRCSHQRTHQLEEGAAGAHHHLVWLDIPLRHRSPEKLARSKKIPCKQLESSLGLLTWATSACQHLRPYLAPLQGLAQRQGHLAPSECTRLARSPQEPHPRRNVCAPACRALGYSRVAPSGATQARRSSCSALA